MSSVLAPLTSAKGTSCLDLGNEFMLILDECRRSLSYASPSSSSHIHTLTTSSPFFLCVFLFAHLFAAASSLPVLLKLLCATLTTDPPSPSLYSNMEGIHFKLLYHGEVKGCCRQLSPSQHASAESNAS